MSKVIKRGGVGGTDPVRISERQEVHMGPRPACFTITLLPSSIPLVPRLHGTQIWLDWPAGHGEGEGWGSWHPGEVEGEAGWRGVD